MLQQHAWAAMLWICADLAAALVKFRYLETLGPNRACSCDKKVNRPVTVMSLQRVQDSTTVAKAFSVVGRALRTYPPEFRGTLSRETGNNEVS